MAKRGKRPAVKKSQRAAAKKVTRDKSSLTAAYLQILQSVRIRARQEAEKRELEGELKTESLIDPGTVVSVMEMIGQQFVEGRPTTLVRVCEKTQLPEQTVSRILTSLVHEHLLHRLDGSSNTVTLAKPPNQITGAELLEVAFRLVDSGQAGEGSRLLHRLRQAQRDMVATTSLAGLLEEA